MTTPPTPAQLPASRICQIQGYAARYSYTRLDEGLQRQAEQDVLKIFAQALARRQKKSA